MHNLDVLDEQGNKTGEALPINMVHQRELWHAAAHVWVYNGKGDILLQKRSATTRPFPGKWDASAAGHVDSGENPLHCAVRELQEELGIVANPADMDTLGVFVESTRTEDGRLNHEFVHLYAYKYDGDPDLLTLQEAEVERVTWMPVELFEDDLDDPETAKNYTPHQEFFEKIIEYVKGKTEE